MNSLEFLGSGGSRLLCVESTTKQFVLATPFDQILACKEMDVHNKLEKLLSLSRRKIVEAQEDVKRLRCESASLLVQEDWVPPPSQMLVLDDEEQERIYQMPLKEQEKALKRLRNKEAARRSRQKKQARVTFLKSKADMLRRQNLILVKCIENFSEKALEAKELSRKVEHSMLQT